MKLSHGLHRPGAQRGMTLIEVMVGLVIGLIGMLVIFQTLTVWDSRTRATTAGSDAQVAGSIAMFAIERDLREAALGIGTASTGAMGCLVQGFDKQASAAIGFPMAPVWIVDNDATNQPDELASIHGSSAYFTSSVKYSRNTSYTIGTYDRSGFKAGDLIVLAANENTLPASAACDLFEVTDNASMADKKTLSVNVGNYDNFYTTTNIPVRYNTASGVDVTRASGWAFNLGPRPQRKVWKIDSASGVLGSTDDINRDLGFVPAAEGVIDLKAEYGYDADPLDSVVAMQWGKTLPAPGDWTQVRAVRVSILVRSRNFEKPTSVATEQSYQAVNPVWHRNGGTVATPFFMKNVDGTPDAYVGGDASANNWRNYRYTVYEKVFPLRNVIWGKE